MKDKTITIFGLGKSGLDVALLLRSLGANVKVTDSQDTPAVRENVQKLGKEARFEIGQHTEQFIEGSDSIVISPGVRSDLPILEKARSKGISVIGEIELAASLCPATIIAITGTNGKSTVTTLTSEVLKYTGKSVFLCGNIGTPLSQCIPLMKKEDLVCLEVSSFQLETIVQFRPKVAAFLNFNCNHLDRHKDMDEYFDFKKRIFMNQDKNDWAVLNYADQRIRALADEIPSHVKYFNMTRAQGEASLNPNFSAVEAIGSIFGVTSEQCQQVFKNFSGLEHRLEFVRTLRGVDFINDSKATTVEACLWALKTINKPIIMIAGGKDKGSDFSVIRESAQKKIKELILIGEARKKIKATLKDSLNIKESQTLEEAVSVALQDSSDGDCVLLSPMCASFDMFTNFEHRGMVFKDIVKGLS
ncbi:UDP-N-acetylmuramoyl-L-alanine--D-glutamate ligase [Candidatus Omnitrophota bacterium]